MLWSAYLKVPSMNENLPSSSIKLLGTAPVDSFSIALRQQLRVLWRRRLLVLSVAGIAAASTWVLLKQITPIYSGNASVMIDSRKTRVLDLKEVITTSQPQLTTVLSEVEVIRSRNVAERVATALNLYEDPEFNPSLRPPATGLAAYIKEAREWVSSLTSTPRPELSAEEKEKAIRAGVVSALLGATSAAPVPQSMVINVSVRSQDPAKAALLTNTLTEQYVLDQLNSKFEATRSASTWLSARLEDLRASVAQAERAVSQYKASTGLIDSKGTLPTQQQLAELNSQLIQTQGRRAELQARVARLETIIRGGGGGDELIDSGLIQRLREQEATLLREISDMATRYGDKHPKMIKGTAELAELRTKINVEMSKVNQGVRNEYTVIRAREQALEDRIKQLEATIVGQNRSEVQLRELEREAQATRTLYENFLNRFKETSEQEQVQQPDARIISKAVTPGAPAFPRKGLILAGMTAIGLLIGTLLALLLERLENTFRSREDLESIIGLPAIGMIPFIEKKPVANYMIDRPTSAFAEALRGLWIGLSQNDSGVAPQVLAITSSFPSEGKSLTALSLARTVSQLGKKVILIDCDLRRSAVAGLLNVRPAFSLEDVLTGRIGVDGAVITDSATPLTILPARNMDRAPLDLLNSLAMENLLAGLRQTYDLVVLDCPPVIPVAEAQVLGRLADRTVFCVLWDKTPREAVGSAVRQLRDVQVNLAGAILTQVHLKKQSRYGYGDIGHYYGRYKGYYAD